MKHVQREVENLVFKTLARYSEKVLRPGTQKAPEVAEGCRYLG